MIPQHHYVSCTGCGTRVHAYDSTTFACPNRDCMPEVNHILQKKHVITSALWQRSQLEDSRNPFVRYRHRLLGYHRALNAHHTDIDYLERIAQLDGALAAIDGTGFTETPLTVETGLAEAIGLDPQQKLFVKNETHNVAGSHKARHLFGVLLNLSKEALKKPFAIASCGNAALAAAVVSKAAGAHLEVYIPTDAEPAVVERLKALGATLHICERREGELGAPCYLRSLDAVKNGAIPFTCQGPRADRPWPTNSSISGMPRTRAVTTCSYRSAAAPWHRVPRRHSPKPCITSPCPSCRAFIPSRRAALSPWRGLTIASSNSSTHAFTGSTSRRFVLTKTT